MHRTINIWNTETNLGVKLIKAFSSWSPTPCYHKKACNGITTTCEEALLSPLLMLNAARFLCSISHVAQVTGLQSPCFRELFDSIRICYQTTSHSQIEETFFYHTLICTDQTPQNNISKAPQAVKATKLFSITTQKRIQYELHALITRLTKLASGIFHSRRVYSFKLTKPTRTDEAIHPAVAQRIYSP